MKDPIHQLSLKLKTPQQVQVYIRSLAYNRKDTLRAAKMVAIKKEAHCFEAAMFAAAILERHGYPPIVMSMESRDDLDHVIYIFQDKGKWGSIGRSRDEGLHGRAPIFKSLRDLALSYYEPYIDHTGEIYSYQIAHLDETGCDWRFSTKNVWKAEQYLIDLKHESIKQSRARYKKTKEAFLKRGHPPRKFYWW